MLMVALRDTGSDCPTGKVQYTAEGAREVRDALRRQGDNPKKYRCPLCGTFHVGHQASKKARRRRHARR